MSTAAFDGSPGRCEPGQARRMDQTYRRRAAVLGGYLHRSHILDLGGTDAMIAGAVALGVLRRIRVGTYVFSDAHDRLGPEERHAVLARSVIDKFPQGSVALSHHSAAVAHGLSVHDVDLRTVHLVRLDGGSGRRESGVVHHDVRPEDHELVPVEGRLTVEPSRAVWEVASLGSPRSALVVMDSALHQGLLSKQDLADPELRFARWPGSRVARLMARLADGGAETAGETLMRFVCWEHRLPRPDTQVVVLTPDGSFVARTDLGWQLYRHVGEFDGLRKYWRDLRPGEDASDVVVREKLREDAIRRLDHGISRATWTEVQPATSMRTAERIAQDLERSRRLYTRARVHVV